MSISGIQGQLLEVTVIGCSRLKDTEWISRQDPYVCLEYASTKFRTRTCTDGHKNPTFQEKFVFTLIEGLREINVSVWNSNTLTFDDFIGSGKIQLEKVLSQGYDDNSWTLQTKSGRYAGEARLILHFANAGKQKPASHSVPSAPPYVSHSVPQQSLYSAPPPVSAAPYGAPTRDYPTASAYSAYPPPPPSAYPPPPYPPPPPAAYPPPPYPPASVYPPPPYPPPHGPPHYPPGPYPGHYPPPY